MGCVRHSGEGSLLEVYLAQRSNKTVRLGELGQRLLYSKVNDHVDIKSINGSLKYFSVSTKKIVCVQ